METAFRGLRITVVIGGEAMTFRTIACLPALIGAWQHCGGGLLYMTAELHYQALNGEAVGLPELEYPTVRSINMVQPGSI